MTLHLRRGAALLIAVVAIAWTAAGLGRTIELTDEDCDRMASIGSAAPRSSWVMHELQPGEYTTIHLDLTTERSFLIRYSLDRIPEGQRITRAEWILPFVGTIPAGEQRLHVRRILGNWGPGVCYEYRLTRPKPEPWHTPGAAGVGTDVAQRASAIIKLGEAGPQIINVTEDVELWYTGATANQGWIVTVEDPGTLIRLRSPLWDGKGTMKLRITYEPE